jgi:hypothetical protein
LNIQRNNQHNGDLLPGRGDVKTAREYERKIRNLLQYQNPDAWQMAARLLQDAGRNRKVSAKQFEHLRGLFGPELSKEWYRNRPKG